MFFNIFNQTYLLLSFSVGAREAEMPIVNKIASAMVCVTEAVLLHFCGGDLMYSSHCTLQL